MLPQEALGFGMTLAVGSVAVLGLVANWLAAGLLAFTIFFYVAIYTAWLKRSTPQNIVIGGAAGAFPPMIGWAAATGAVGLESVLMFLIIFFWTPPHFWALSLWRTQDYARAGIPMLPVVAGPAETRRQILIYALVLAPIGASPWLFGYAGLDLRHHRRGGGRDDGAPRACSFTASATRRRATAPPSGCSAFPFFICSCCSQSF